MISAIYLHDPNLANGSEIFRSRMQQLEEHLTFSDERFLLTDHHHSVQLGPDNPPSFVDQDLVVACSGSPRYEPQSSQDTHSPGKASASSIMASLYRQNRSTFPAEAGLYGNYAACFYHRTSGDLLLLRDQFGIEPIYYAEDRGILYISSTIKGVITLLGNRPDISAVALSRILLFNYNIGNQTIFRKIRKLPAAHILTVQSGHSPHLKRYWQLDFTPSQVDETSLAGELLSQLRNGVNRCLQARKQAGVFLSGGMDSSTVLGLSHEQEIDLSTFSYRCKAASFDESHYARIMAGFVGSHHHECEYSSAEVLLMPEVVEAMNEPFCDVGINIATYLLGREAATANCPFILTGDGGDELFGGHPVYEADKIAHYADRIPRPLLHPVLALFRLLPDSDQKKNLTVKLKRFAESLAFPADLLSHRWRMYYGEPDLRRILAEDFAQNIQYAEVLESILAINNQYHGPDLLATSLHSDYQTVVDFYLRRNDLIRRFGIQIAYPMFDPQLVSFCANIPSAMKIAGWFDTKYIFKKAMEPVLPHEIIYRKDKLGHSIPLKNWIREDRRVRELILDHLSDESLAKRQLFQRKEVNRFIDDHMKKRKNNSHRLWTLAVIEMWLRHHLD